MDEYQAFEATQTGDWKIRLLVPTKEYYQQVYVMALNLSLLTLALIAFCILVSILQWQSIYRPFTKFEKKAPSDRSRRGH